MQVKLLPAAVIFDMDGVLVDSEPHHAESYVRAFAETGIELTAEHYRRTISLGHATVRELYVSLGGNMDRWHDISKAKGRIVGELFNEHGTLMPGVVRLLETLKGAGIPTALATSAGRRSFGVIMDKFDLRHYFQHIITWEDVSAIKPDPQAFITAAERLGAACEECLIFEDSPRGVLAAHRAGIKCIAVPNNSTSDGDFSTATLVVKSLEMVDLEMMRNLF